MIKLEIKYGPAKEDNQTSIVRVIGIVDTMNVDEFFRILHPIAKSDTQRIILDISELVFISSAAISVIVDTYNSLKAKGGDLVLIASQGIVLETLKTVQLDRKIKITDTLREAKETCGL